MTLEQDKDELIELLMRYRSGLVGSEAVVRLFQSHVMAERRRCVEVLLKDDLDDDCPKETRKQFTKYYKKLLGLPSEAHLAKDGLAPTNEVVK